jgi:hypothetical protein
VGPQELVDVLPTLLSIATLNGGAENLGSFLAEGKNDRRLELALVSASTKPEFVVLGLLPIISSNEPVRSRFRQLNRRDGSTALRQLELAYATRIDLLRGDRFHWKTLRPRAELIDWSLLIALIALVRNHAMKFRISQTKRTLSPMEFTRSLALELATLEEQLRPS